MTGTLLGMTESLEALGKRVEAARLAKGWGKERAGREADVSSITWKRVEDGLPTQDAKLAAVLNAVGITRGEGGPSPPVEGYDELLAEIEQKLSPKNRERLLQILNDQREGSGEDGSDASATKPA